MATIKSYSDLQQSKKLAEILPPESADMSWVSNGLGKPFARTIPIKGDPEELCVCWSLTALYNILPNTEHISTTLSRGGWKIEPTGYVDKWWCEYEDDNDHTRDVTVTADNPVDACVAMVEKLNELKML